MKSAKNEAVASDGPRTYRPHPAAEHLPLMGSLHLEELARDIERYGLLHPIVLHEGKILDGRNRHLACGMTERPRRAPRFVEWAGECGTPAQYVLAMNIHGRRHLTPEQRMFSALAMLPELAAEALARSKAGKVISSKEPGAKKGRATEILAEAAGVSRATVERARNILEHGNEKLIEAVKHQEIAIGDAATVLVEAPELVQQALAAVLPVIRGQEKSGPKTLAAYVRSIREPAAAAPPTAAAAPHVDFPAVADGSEARNALEAITALGPQPAVTGFRVAGGFVIVTFGASVPVTAEAA